MSLKFFCVVYPDDKPFAVTAGGDDTIDDLKDAIKVKTSPDLQHIAAHKLTLWKLEPYIPIDDNLQTALEEVKFDGSWRGGQKLGPAKMIKNMFPDAPAQEHLHVIVQLPATKKRPHSPTLSPMPSVKRAREQHNEHFPSAVPSTTGDADKFSECQKHRDGPYAYCNRPATASSIPVTLLHPVFGTFVDECSTYTPTCHDHAFVTELSTAMSAFFANETLRRAVFLEIVNTYYDLGLQPSDIAGGSYRTDGHCMEGAYMCCLTVAKNELAGGGGAEPYLQGCAYYREWAKRQNTKSASSLPCLLIYYCGNFFQIFRHNDAEVRVSTGASFGFAGLASTDRPHLDTLGPILPLFCHVHDIQMRTTIARFFGACKHAVDSLKTYYSKELPTLLNRNALSLPDPRFPYPDSYTSLTGDKSLQAFVYTGRFSADLRRLIFYGKSVGRSNGEQQLFIKFTRSYSKAAHQYCAQAGYAPTLHGFAELPGGWYMAVMENLDKDTYPMYLTLQSDLDAAQRRKISKELRACIGLLHSQKMVHGDLRDSNILVSKDDAPQIKLIDFDWAGEMDAVCYPINLNRQDMHRPESALDGTPITKEHDIEMIDCMFREGNFAPGGSLATV